MSGISVVIPTIPTRQRMLNRALQSVQNQLLQPDAIIVVQDNAEAGATATRTRGLSMVDTEWTAFLDDDDELYPVHLQALMMHAETHGADLVFPWFDVAGGTDPFPENEGRQFDVENPHQTTVTFLVRTEIAKELGGFYYEPGVDADDPGADEQGHRAGEEYRFVIRLARAGHKVVHLDQRTWKWNHHPGNTMGLPSKVKPGQADPDVNVDTIRAAQVGYAI